MEIGSNSSISFKAGLTCALKKGICNVRCSAVEGSLKENFNICSDFNDNKTLAKLMSDSIDICKEVSEKYHLPFFVSPPKIRVYNQQELTSPHNPRFGFCIGESFKILKKEPEYPKRSIFIKNIKDSAELLNNNIDDWYKARITSTDSIFGPFIHELMHNVHLGILFEKLGFQKGLEMAKKMSSSDSMSYIDKYIIKEEIGDYAAVSKMELLPEVTAKIISESLNSDNKVVRNPIENLMILPEFVQNFVKNQLGI